MGAKIRFATTESDRNAAFRFRYEIYVHEMKRIQKYADHECCTIEEPLDKTGHILIAQDAAGRTVGTARFNLGADTDFGLYEELYQLREFESFYPSSVSITTKLMVAPEYRCSPLPLQLAVRCYVVALGLGSVFDCIDCNKHLVGFFRKLGYRQILPAVFHPEYGHVVPMVLALYDVAHLEIIRSPFAKYARRVTDHRGSLRFFHEKFLSKPERDWGTSFRTFENQTPGAKHESLAY